jgi:hypothetical protein
MMYLVAESTSQFSSGAAVNEGRMIGCHARIEGGAVEVGARGGVGDQVARGEVACACKCKRPSQVSECVSETESMDEAVRTEGDLVDGVRGAEQVRRHRDHTTQRVNADIRNRGALRQN